MKKEKEESIDAAFFSEMLRKDILKKYGENLLYKEGLIIKTTLDSKLQKSPEIVCEKDFIHTTNVMDGGEK
ncbi:MAG: hypothetical protein H6925_03005 [Holosporaceae bacterium]|nr:MAG: hypothetical protein H6925_03005 [Holosporaceae bacterium]